VSKLASFLKGSLFVVIIQQFKPNAKKLSTGKGIIILSDLFKDFHHKTKNPPEYNTGGF